MDLISREVVANELEKHQYSREFCIEHNIDCAMDMGMVHITVASIPSAFDGMTNGEVMKTVYTDSEIEIDEAWKTVTVFLGADEDYCEDEVRFDLDWWNSPYKKGEQG